MSDSDASDELGRGPFWAPDLPLLQLNMLVPRQRRMPAAFPFNHPRVEYVHFARNAIYKAVSHFGLAGAEVLVPAYFHGVEVEALVAAGVRPRFFPVRRGMHVDPDDVVQRIGPATRAIYLIHYLGFPGPVEELQRICRDRGLILFEDCALALLSMVGDRPLGSFGDASFFCIYKTLPTLDGGAVVLREGRLNINGVRPRAAGIARETGGAVLRAFQRRRGTLGRRMISTAKNLGKRLARRTEEKWVPVGTQDFNPADAELLMSPVSRVILEGQKLEDVVSKRRRNFVHLRSLLADLAPDVFDALPAGVCPLFYPFITRRKLKLWQQLEAQGVQAVLFWLPRQFSPPQGEFPEVDELRQTVLELPCHQDMTPSDIERMANIVRSSVRALER